MGLEGIIIRQISGFYDVLCDDDVISCKAKGVFRKEKISPMVGDNVLINKDKKLITSIIPRKNQFRRPAVSNINHLWVIVAAKDPMPDHMLIDKLIITAIINNIKPLLILNKVDLATKNEIDKFEKEYMKTGYSILKISCKMITGIDEIKKSFYNGIVALAGQSGVGKSSLLNLLCSDVRLNVGELSMRTATGKHTTTHAQIIPLQSGVMLIDTPGFSSLEIDQIMPDTLQFYYSEFEPFIGQCRFSDCLHNFEPDCDIKNAVRDKLISIERYERYVSILRNLIDEKGRNVK